VSGEPFLANGQRSNLEISQTVRWITATTVVLRQIFAPGALGGAAKIRETAMNDYKDYTIDALAPRELTIDEIDNVSGGATFAPPHGDTNPPPLPIQWDNLKAAPPVLY
jgi:hypothetical protein